VIAINVEHLWQLQDRQNGTGANALPVVKSIHIPM